MCHVRTGELFTACRSYWPTDRAAPWVNLERNARQAFGRSLHRLQAAALIWPLARSFVSLGAHGGAGGRVCPSGLGLLLATEV